MSTSSRAIVLDLKQLRMLSSYAHWIPILNGLHREFMAKNYPGWQWNQIIPVLVEAKILVPHSMDTQHRALCQGLYISREIKNVRISWQSGETNVEVGRE